MLINPVATPLLLLIQLLILKGCIADHNNFKCSKKIENYKCRLSTKTPYRFVANSNDDEIKFPGCKAKKIWLVIRHGTRLPEKKINTLLKDLPRLQEQIIDECNTNKCQLTESQIKKLQEWNLPIIDDEKMLLTEEGENELIGLGERYQSRFPQIIPEKYENKTFKFKYTATQRTAESAKYFTIGLFGKKGSQDVWYPEPEDKDPILRFYKACGKWQQDVKKNPKTYEQLELFKNSSVVKTMLQKLSTRLGVKINYDTAQSIYTICAFETAWSEKNQAPWCDLLTTEDFKIVEYEQDLQYYWRDGYGYELTYKQACVSLIDMFNFFNNDDSDTTVSAYFTHSGTLLKMISLLNIAKDEKLFHDLYTESDDRNWRTSFIDAFATNLAFVLYKCNNGPGILLLHQERIVNLPGCPENIPCPLKIMQEKFPDNAEECLFKEMCSNEN